MSEEKGSSVEEAAASPTTQSTNGSHNYIESVSSSSQNDCSQALSLPNDSSRGSGNSTPNHTGSYGDKSVVWVRLGQSWWPGCVVALERCPQDFVCDLKKTPLAVVKFFDENGFVDIHKQEHIYPYNCERKKEFIKKGINFHARRLHHYSLSTENNLRSMQNKEELFKKFESDVLMAQKLTGGSQEVFTQIEEDSNKRRIDYSNLGFGPPKPKKKKEEPRRLGSDISEAIRYKKDTQEADCSGRQMVLQHKVVIMEQPHVENMKEDLNKACNSYTCYTCGFTCSRLGVIIWHYKSHTKTVMDYDTGIRMPGRKKRKPKTIKPKTKGKKLEKGAVDHSKSNGHVEPDAANSLQARELLMDWDDDDENEGEANSPEASSSHLNNGHAEGLGSGPVGGDNNNAEEYIDRPQTERKNRRPMRGAEDLNSAFDALLADTPNSSGLTSNDQLNSYSNNDSDSEASDWEKYYAKDSDDDEENEADEVKESDIKSLCEGSEMEEASVPNGDVKDNQSNGAVEEETFGSMSDDNADNEPSRDSVTADTSDQVDNAEADEELEEEDEEEEEEEEESLAKDTEGSSSTTSSSPSNSGPAFMLVAVDAQGNNVPMPALTDRNHSSNLVAVEASMEDGTSRTLYIDPAYLEPNVDLSNLMLHIDNSGQETVIIPSTTSQDTVASSTPPRDSSGPAAARTLPGVEDRLTAHGSTASMTNMSQPPASTAMLSNPALDPSVSPCFSPRPRDTLASAGFEGASTQPSEEASQAADHQYSTPGGAGAASPRR